MIVPVRSGMSVPTTRACNSVVDSLTAAHYGRSLHTRGRPSFQQDKTIVYLLCTQLQPVQEGMHHALTQVRNGQLAGTGNTLHFRTPSSSAELQYMILDSRIEATALVGWLYQLKPRQPVLYVANLFRAGTSHCQLSFRVPAAGQKLDERL